MHASLQWTQYLVASSQCNQDAWLNITVKATICVCSTNLPRLSAAVQHKERDGIDTTWGKGEEKDPSQLKKCQFLILPNTYKCNFVCVNPIMRCFTPRTR